MNVWGANNKNLYNYGTLYGALEVTIESLGERHVRERDKTVYWYVVFAKKKKNKKKLIGNIRITYF